MRYLNRFSDNTLRFAFIVIAVFCFIIISLSFIDTMITQRQTVDGCLWVDVKDSVKLDTGTCIVAVTPGGVADDAGLKNGDILMAINGKGFKNSNKAQNILDQYNGETVTYTVIRDGKTFDAKIWVYKFFNALYLIFALICYSFLFIGFLVGYSKPKELTSQLFFIVGCASMGLLLLANLNFGGIQSGVFVFYNYYTALTFFIPVFLHFCLTYPVKLDIKRRKTIILYVYMLPLAFFASGMVVTFLDVPFPGFGVIRIILLNLYLLIGIGVFARSYMKLKDVMLKRSLNVILKGFVIGAIGFIYYFGFLYYIDVPAFLVDPLYFIPALLVLAIPLSFGYSIFKYRILDTEFIVKRGLVFGIITTFIIGIYLFLVFVLNYLLSEHFSEEKQILTILTIVIITFSFDYVNKKAKNFVDKQFYRERYNYRKSLLLFSQELPYLTNINEILTRIALSVNETMGVSNVNIWIHDTDYASLVDKDTGLKDKDFIEVDQPTYNKAFTDLFKKNKDPKLLYEVNLNELKISERYKDVFRKEKVVLSIPIFLKDKLLGAINFGNKPSGKAYSDEDIDLLKTLASQSAIAFENARLQLEEINKQKMEEELKVARKIQNSLLPEQVQHIEGLNISWLSQPAKMIGGDFYDLIKIDEKRFLVIVADVSGKGIPAALYMSQVQAMIQFAANIFKTPREILTEVNKLIYEKIDKRSFITMIAALFDLENNTVKISRAGHNPAIMSLNGKVEILKNKGMGLGLENETLFETHLEESELPLTPDNLFVFYSDGLTEAMNVRKEEFTTEKTMEIVTKYRYSDTSVILDNVMDSVKAFTGKAEQNDDITLVVVKTT